MTATNNEVAESKSTMKSIADYLNSPKVKEQLALVLPKHIGVDRLARICFSEIQQNPKLLQCSIPSLLAVVMKAAKLGLEPGILGHCYFVPYYNSKKQVHEVQFIEGYKGLLQLVRRSGDLSYVDTGVVHEKDTFEYEKGFEAKLKHVPNMEDRGAAIAYYALCVFKDGGKQFEVMSKKDIEKIRDRSKAKDNGPWITDFDEMAKKTVLKRLCKLLPLSIEDQRRISEDTEREFGETKTELNLGLLPEEILSGE